MKILISSFECLKLLPRFVHIKVYLHRIKVVEMKIFLKDLGKQICDSTMGKQICDSTMDLVSWENSRINVCFPAGKTLFENNFAS